jgi:hypothetical protein
VSARGRAEVSLATSQHSGAGARQRYGSGLALCAYCVEAGITATAVGAWASSGFSGVLRAVTWIGITALLALGATWLAEPAVTALERCLRITTARRDLSRR